MFKQILANPVTPVPPVSLATIKKWLNGEGGGLVEVINESSYVPITGVNIDTRTLNNRSSADGTQGSANLDNLIQEAFLPLDGKHYQGLSLVTSAYESGARVFIIAAKYREGLSLLPLAIARYCTFIVVETSEHAYGQIAKQFIRLLGGFRIAITGSAGKTSTKEMLMALLGSTHPVTGKPFGVYANFKNENNLIGVPKNIFQLQKELLTNNNPNRFPEGQVHFLIFELGMNTSGEISRLAEIVSPHLALITNILHSHIGNFSHRNDLAHAKGEVIQHLQPYTPSVSAQTGEESIPILTNLPPSPSPLLFLPHDIYAKELLVKKIKTAPHSVELREVNTTSSTSIELVKKNNRIYLETRVSFLEGSALLNEDRQSTKVVTKSIRGIQVFLAELLALVSAVGVVFGFDISAGMSEEVLAKTIDVDKPNRKTFPKAESRLQVISLESEDAPLIIDDSYNSNPDSLARVLLELIGLFQRNPAEIKLVFVLGDVLELGEFESELYKKLAEKINHGLRMISPDNQTGVNPDLGQGMQFFFLGKGIKICYDNLNFESKHYFPMEKYKESNEVENIMAELYSVCDSNTIVFFKASQGLQFQKLVSDFIRRFT